MSNPEPAAEDDPPQPAPEAKRIIDAKELFAGAREVWILHGDVQYRLRITAAGKLILTK